MKHNVMWSIILVHKNENVMSIAEVAKMGNKLCANK